MRLIQTDRGYVVPDKFAVECLRAFIFRTAIPSIPKSGPHDDLIVGRFIKHHYNESDPIFESVIVFVKGQMYANAINCPDLESLEKNFRNVTFYMDTQLILNIS